MTTEPVRRVPALAETAAEQTQRSNLKKAVIAETRLIRYRTIKRHFLATLEPSVLDLLAKEGHVGEEDRAWIDERLVNVRPAPQTIDTTTGLEA